MLFNSITFLLFFIIIVLIHYSRIQWKYKKISLLAGSYIFYAAWNPPFILLLFLSTLVDWNLAGKIDKSTTQVQRKKWLALSIVFNIGILSIFKYSGFLLSNFQHLMGLFGFEFKSFDPGIILPMGISFYTFQTLSYTIDVYQKKIKPHHSFLDYALFVSFFPQLVAGPIVRAKDFLPQLKQQNNIGFNAASIGMSLFIIGIFTKTVLADAFFAPFVDSVFSSDVQADSLSSWLAAIFFYAQIFSDFAGYSLCAIGTAMVLGFIIPLNFRAPFSASGFSDFWRKWHISLSSWLRDYLYIPLGGNRQSRLFTFRNLMITMLLGGLWHGAAWTFVIWGLIHGLYLILERWVKSFSISKFLIQFKVVQLLMVLITFFLVMVAFVIFRAESIDQSLMIFKGMFNFSDGTSLIEWNLWTQIVTLAFAILFISQNILKKYEITHLIAIMPIAFKVLFLTSALVLISLSSGNSNAFIYFQF